MNYNWDYLDAHTYNNRSGNYKFKRAFAFVTEHLADSAQNILDIGGGSGRFAVPLLNRSKEVTVIDINPIAIELLKSRENRALAICANFLTTPIEEIYSSVLCIETMCYFPDVKQALLKINKLLSMNGNVIFTYTNTKSWRFFLRKFKGLFFKKTIYYDVSFKELKELLIQCQFEIESVEGMNWIPFSVNSNSKIVTLFAYIEDKLNLKNWHSQSPWLLISAKKVGEV